MARTKTTILPYDEDQESFFKALLKLCNSHSLAANELSDTIPEFLEWAAESDPTIKIQLLEEKVAALEMANKKAFGEPVAA